MSSNRQTIFSIALITIGWVLNAIAWTIGGPHPINTIIFVTGTLGFIIGLIWLIVTIANK